MQEVIEQAIDYLKGIWIKRRYIIIATWLICPLGWYFVSQLDDVYESEARVYVDTQSLLRPLLKGLTVETNPQVQIQLMIKTLLSRPNLERITRMTDLDVQATTEEEYEAILDRLKKNIKISRSGRENIYTLSISDKDPQTAKNIVQSALTVFIENTLGESRSEADSAQKFLANQIKEYENRLLTDEAKLTAFKQKHNDILLQDGGGYYSSLNTEKSKLEQAQLELTEAQTKLKSARQQLANGAPNKDILSSKVQNSQSISTTFDDRISQLETSLDSLLLRYTVNHPDVKELQRRLEELNKQRDDEIDRYYQSVKNSDSDQQSNFSAVDQSPVFQELKILVNQYQHDVASLSARVNNYQEKVSSLESKIHTLPEIEAQLVALNRGYDITKSKYDELLVRRETALLAQEADETTDKIQFNIIDPPRAASKPSGPPRVLFFVGVTIFGFGVGIGLSLLFSQINPVVTSSSLLTRSTGIPVFGIVSATENLGLKGWHRRKTLLFVLSNILLLIVLSGFIAFFAFPEAVQGPLRGIL